MSKKMTEGMYWEYRCTAEELKSSKLNEKRTHLERELMNKTIEIHKLKLVFPRSVILINHFPLQG